jgi:hypothetical protein
MAKTSKREGWTFTFMCTPVHNEQTKKHEIHGVLWDKEHRLYKKKGKAIPLQAWTGPEGSRRLRHTDFKTIGT